MYIRRRSASFALIIAVLAFVVGSAMASEVSCDARIKEILPEYEKYIQEAMNEFQVSGMAIGIVQGNKLVYAKGFGLRANTPLSAASACKPFW